MQTKNGKKLKTISVWISWWLCWCWVL